MKSFRLSCVILGWRSIGLAFCLLTYSGQLAAAEPVSYSRDIQPLLAKTCYACHGPDESSRQADLELNNRKVAIEHSAIVPGKPEESELVRRIFSTDPAEQMPPPDAKESLTAAQKEKLKLWIAQGAKYETHWSFTPPIKPALPKVKEQSWPKHAIDYFSLSQMEKRNSGPSPEADKYTLVRRVYLDLIGLPPTPREADAFVRDTSPKAYEKLVDHLLSSEHYGERWARLWLDLARYSDTNGYEKDRPRSIWPYRDWVIEALNRDMPYDEFSIKQIAGDMLPDRAMKDRIATGFHRNTMLNEEGGIDPLEYRFYAMVDRVATTGTVWLGLTTGCAQCHSHKYDPISHTDYYRLMALLNNADEPELAVKEPELVARRQALFEQINQLTKELKNQFPPAQGSGSIKERRRQNFTEKFSDWVGEAEAKAVSWTPLRPSHLESNLPRLEVLEDRSIFSSGDITKRDVFELTFPLAEITEPITAFRLEALPDERLPAGGPGRAYYEGRKGDFFLSEVIGTIEGQPIKFSSASHSYGKISIGSGNANAGNVIDGDGSTGWSTAGREGEAHQLVLNLAKPIDTKQPLVLKLIFERHFAASLGRFRISAATSTDSPQATSVPVEIEQLLAKGHQTWTAAERADVENYFLSVTPRLAEARKPIENLKSQLPSFPTTLVFEERPADNPRTTHRHHRGEYLSSREEVSPGVPKIFPPLPEGQPANRLTFARWLVSRRNPLASRVAVNRAWRAFFGNGLVRTNGDYGTQSDPPTHPELLDWLSCEFVEQGWSLKKLHRMMVLSATYRQSSVITQDRLNADPENVWLSRGPRHQVEAEMVRDILLKASGLLSEKIGGSSVYPPQPASVTALAYGNTPWKASEGEDRYRRSLYTFSKRTAPFAAYAVFNGPTGENCIAKRDRSTTPLQALTLLNDEMFLEMARALAADVMNVETKNDKIATAIFRRLLTRPPSEREQKALLDFYEKQQRRFAAGELDAAKVSGIKNCLAGAGRLGNGDQGGDEFGRNDHQAMTANSKGFCQVRNVLGNKLIWTLPILINRQTSL